MNALVLDVSEKRAGNMESMRLPCSFDVSATYLVICDIDFLRHSGGIEMDKLEALICKCMKSSVKDQIRGAMEKSPGWGADNGDRQNISCQTERVCMWEAVFLSVLCYYMV